jgi:hypothetical protein
VIGRVAAPIGITPPAVTQPAFHGDGGGGGTTGEPVSASPTALRIDRSATTDPAAAAPAGTATGPGPSSASIVCTSATRL